MSKKHYIAVADILNRAYHGYSKEAIGYITNELVVVLKQDNPNFDAARFRDAVVAEETKKK